MQKQQQQGDLEPRLPRLLPVSPLCPAAEANSPTKDNIGFHRGRLSCSWKKTEPLKITREEAFFERILALSNTSDTNDLV